MTICLYECLRAAGLQHHYARFTLMGVCRAVHLSALSMEDYPLLGVCSMLDRTRLFHLIQMIKTLDLNSLACDDGYNFDFDRGDEGYAALDGSFTPDGFVNHDEAENDNQTENGASVVSPESFIFARPSCVRRRLSFSDENLDRCERLVSCPVHTVHVYGNSDINDELVDGKQSATLVQLEHDRRNDLCGYQRSNHYKQGVQSFLCNRYDGENIKTELTGDISRLDSDTRFASNCKTFPKHKPSHTKVTRKPPSNKPCGYKDRRELSRKNICYTDSSKLTPVHEVKTTAGYNYGLPLSSPHAPKNKKLGGQRISVCVRKRPLTCGECKRGEANVVTTPGGECVIVHESKETVDLTHYILQHRFYFDQVFGEESCNEDVYQRTAYPLVQHMLRGGKATCFAYGQTGAGKTHTMLGLCPGRPGLYALAARDIFAQLSTTHSSLVVFVSFFEIYCGQLHDLLNHRKRLFAREDGQKVVHIADLKNVRVDSVSSLLQVISKGTEERTQGISGVNAFSSRSHALLQIQLRDPNQQIAGRMWFVDLAGSERASDTKDPDRQSRMEGAEINQSLLALKECIRSLDKENSHTPFRQSKLTQVLKDSFVGDSLTCMIANISPGHPATEHTLNTLRYADRVKELKGQGGLGGRRGCKMVPSPKQNLSSRGGNVGTPKRHKPAKQSQSLGPSMPTTKLHTDGTYLCSTPKNNRCGEETQARDRKAVAFEHTTPLRGCLRKRDGRCPCEGADTREGGRLENETDRNAHSNDVRPKSTKPVPVLVQKTDEKQKEGELNEGHVAFTERESGFHSTEKEHYQKTRAKTEKEWLGTGRQVENSRDTNSEVNWKKQRDFNSPDKEKQRHLKWYHQHLQQFVPSTPSVQLCSSSTCFTSTQSSLSSPQQSSCRSVSAHLFCGLEEISDTSTPRVDVRVNCDAQKPSPSGETHVQKETSTNSSNTNDRDIHSNYLDVSEEWRLSGEGTGPSTNKSEKRKLIEAMVEEREMKEGKKPAGMEERGVRSAWAATAEHMSAIRTKATIPTHIETQVSSRCAAKDRREVGVEALIALNIQDDGVWSTQQRGAVNNHSLESSHTILSHPSLNSPHQQAPAERPLSPAHTNVLQTPEKKSKALPESQYTRCNNNICMLQTQRTPQAVLLNSQAEKEPHFAACDSKSPFSPAWSTTLTLTTKRPPECPVYVHAHNCPDLKDKVPVLPKDERSVDSFSYIMNPLSSSLPQMQTQAAITSCPQRNSSSTSHCLPASECGEHSRRELGKGCLSCVDKVRTFSEDEDAKIHQSPLERPQAKILQQTSDSLTATGHSEQEKYIRSNVCGIGTYNHDNLGLGFVLKDQESDQGRHIPSVHDNRASASPLKQSTSASTQNFVSSPSVQHFSDTGSLTISNPKKYACYEDKNTSSSITTQQPESIPGHLTQVYLNHFRKPHVSPKSNSDCQINNNQQHKPRIQLYTLDNMDHAKWCIVEAHLEQLKEMEALCHKERMLLSQQHNMAFQEYVHKLEEFMKQKARCVHIMGSLLQPHLKPMQSNYTKAQDDPVVNEK
ncbi:kinesin-like protein KIF24 [Cololabis saira]|uniref:kinesin-like protein KIF24 n=1 Tax=Cololabis saira TaxID=129043 RepID=UPI002AD50ABF|nr:kinesin-like protein KIF24 [Cololabis saira]XP_061585217.1 kinesin-like protein KIF24 [Cololabis saira]